MRSNATLALVLALVAGAVLGATGAWLVLRPRTRPGAIAPVSPDPAALVPPGARGVLLADVTRLRAAPSLARFFGEARPGDPCEARLLRRVRRVAIAVADASFESLAVAFAGDLPHEELLACARARQASGDVHADRYRGLARVRIAPRVEPGLLPPASAAEIVYLPGGVVVAGEGELVERMVDRGLATDGGGDVASVTGELLHRVGSGHAVRLALRMPARGRGEGGARAALAHVAGVAAGASFDEGAELELVLACDDFDAPRAVADALDQLRGQLAGELHLPALAAPLRAATIERRAADVRVHLALSTRELDALLLAAESLAESLPVPAAEPSRDR
jgi:hypothetical protein